MIAEIRRYDEFCFDTETTGFDLFNDRIVGMSFAVVPHEAWYVPCDERNTPVYAELLRPLFEEERIAKIGQNIKFDLMVLRRIGIAVRGRKYDTMILHYLLDPESRHNLNALAVKYLNYKPIEIETLIGRGPRQLTMDLVGVERVAEYAAEDADVTLRLKQLLTPRIEEAGLHDLYFDIEEPMIEVLADMEMTGVCIDTEALARYAVELNRRMGRLEADIRAEAGEPSLNINSTRQLGEVLFAKMRIAEKPKMTRTEEGKPVYPIEKLPQFCKSHKVLMGIITVPAEGAQSVADQLIAVGVIIAESIGRMLHPEPVVGGAIAWTAGIGVVVNGFTAWLFLKDKERDLNVKGAYLHMAADALVSIGVLVSGVVISWTGWTLIDPIVGLAVAGVIVASVWSLTRDSLRLSLDGVPAGIDVAELERRMRAVPGVQAVHHIHVWALSTTENALTAHVVLSDFSELERIKRDLKALAAHSGISHATLEFETASERCADLCD